jgi:hypothetical protein
MGINATNTSGIHSNVGTSATYHKSTSSMIGNLPNMNASSGIAPQANNSGNFYN